MNRRFLLSLLAALPLGFSFAAEDYLTYEPKGESKGKHVVLIAGDEEYRSEEGLPQLAKILSERHGFKATVLFSVDRDGFIDANNQASLTNPAALDSADAIIMLIRFRHWPDEAMKHFHDAVQRGVPIVGLRTATHAFNMDKASAYGAWAWNNAQGGFGRMVLGETWFATGASTAPRPQKASLSQRRKTMPFCAAWRICLAPRMCMKRLLRQIR